MARQFLDGWISPRQFLDGWMNPRQFSDGWIRLRQFSDGWLRSRQFSDGWQAILKWVAKTKGVLRYVAIQAQEDIKFEASPRVILKCYPIKGRFPDTTLRNCYIRIWQFTDQTLRLAVYFSADDCIFVFSLGEHKYNYKMILWSV